MLSPYRTGATHTPQNLPIPASSTVLEHPRKKNNMKRPKKQSQPAAPASRDPANPKSHIQREGKQEENLWEAAARGTLSGRHHPHP